MTTFIQKGNYIKKRYSVLKKPWKQYLRKLYGHLLPSLKSLKYSKQGTAEKLRRSHKWHSLMDFRI